MFKKEEATLHDYAKLCDSMVNCYDCPLNEYHCYGYILAEHIDEFNIKAVNWCNKYPIESESKLKATIYDCKRMCKSMKGCCDCPFEGLRSLRKAPCFGYDLADKVDEYNDVILVWKKENEIESKKSE